MAISSLYVLFLAVTVHLTTGAVLKNGVVVPTYTQVCRRSLPDINECLKNSLQELIPKISKNGIKEIELGSLDPVYVPELLTSMSGGGYTFNSKFRNSYTHGMSRIKILDVRSDFSDNENINLEVDFYIPKVLIKGNYKVDGIIAEFAVNGKGPYNISMTDVQGTLKINGHVIKEDEVEYFRVHKVSMQPDVGNMSIYFANLVNGNPELSAIAVTFFNQFWRVIYPEILPYADETFDKVLRNLINQATLKIPYNQLIPE